MKIKKAIKKVLNLPHSEPTADHSTVVSPNTHDILIRANEQGERLVRMEAPHMARTGNPFGDILERRVDRGVNHA